MFKPFKDRLWKWQVKDRLGISDPIHLSLHYDKCELALWDYDDVPYLYNKPNDLELTEKLLSEYKNNERNTVVKPVQHIEIENIITNVGLLEIAKRDVGTSSTTNLWYLFGDSATAEDLADTALGNQVYSASFASRGTRGTIDASRTEKFLMPVLDTDYTGAIKEAGLATGNNPPTDVLFTHYTFPTITISSLQLISALTTIVHQNGTVA